MFLSSSLLDVIYLTSDVALFFQAVRNENDLQCVNVPQKFRAMNSFWKYYSGEAVAPYPTIFIGGNHEASNYLWEL
jgi:lariat debranching enzyme